MTLSDLLPGETALILHVSAQTALRKRLLDLGFTPGVRVALVGCAPLGDPLEVRLRGYTLALLRRDAACITVTGYKSDPMHTL